MRRTLYIALFFLSLSISLSARADIGANLGAEILDADSSLIRGLHWDTSYPEVKNITVHGQTESVVMLKGKYKRDQWSLTSEKYPVRNGADGNFYLEVPVENTNDQTLELTAIGPSGASETQEVTLTFGEWETLRHPRIDPDTSPTKRLYTSFGLGLTSISHAESIMPTYTSIAVTAKAGINYLLFPPRWDLGFSGYITAFQLTKSQDIDVRYIGANARIGFVFTRTKSPWKIALYGGMYYTTMVVQDSAFGFRNMIGPQVYPAVRYKFMNGNSLNFYAKYSPVTGSFSVLTLANHEIAGGVSYVAALSSGQNLSYSLDVSNLSLVITGVSITTSVIVLGMGVGF